MSPLLHTPIHTEAILQPQLVGVKLEIEASSQLARSTVDGLTPRELTQQPGPQSWSVAECLAHLNLTSKAYLPLVTMAIENALLDGRYGSAPYRIKTGRDISSGGFASVTAASRPKPQTGSSPSAWSLPARSFRNSSPCKTVF